MLERGLDLPAPVFEHAAEDDAGRELDGPAAVDLTQLAAEAAYAAARPTRAVAYAESALAALGPRTDRLRHAVLESRLGQYRLAAGDAAGATAALRRAADVAPPEPTVERARILALLAQERMIAGAFRDAERAAEEALAVAKAVGRDAEPEAIHALTTVAVVHGWGDDPEAALPLLHEAVERARAAGLIEEWWRAVANQAVILELLGRPSEAVDVTFEGMREVRALDLDAVYGNLLAGNVAGILVDVGRWKEARELSLRALDWSPAGVPFVNAILNLVIVEIESEAGEEAGRLLGRILVELETGGDIQFAIPAYQATASYAMWSGDLADARRAAERGWARLKGTEDWVLVARMAATALEVESAIVGESLERRRIGDVAASRERAGRILAEAEAAVARARTEVGHGTGEPEASLATARAFHARLMGRDDPVRWADLAERWHRIGDPYREARARWRQAEAILGGAIAGPGGRDRTDARLVRADAREPLLAAVSLALGLHARPLLRRLRELAGRALIVLPPEVETLLDEPAPAPSVPRARVSPGPVGDVAPAPTPAPARPAASSDTFGLSKRELEVLRLIAQGRTNREIGDRLFISQKTVGVHVGNILAKLGVSGRVEAAAVAIRLGLESSSPSSARPPGIRSDSTRPKRVPREPVPKPEVPMRRPLLLIALVAVAALTAACTSSAPPGWTYAAPTPAPSQPAASGSAAPASQAPASAGTGGGPVQISAQGVQFEQKAVSAPAGAAFVIHFDNKDTGQLHNVAIKDGSGAEVFKGTFVNGPGTADYQVPALTAGAYTFVCDVHANMTGTLTAG